MSLPNIPSTTQPEVSAQKWFKEEDWKGHNCKRILPSEASSKNMQDKAS